MAHEHALSVDDVAPGVATTRRELIDQEGPPHRTFITTNDTSSSTTGITISGATITTGGNEMMTNTEYDRRYGQGQTHRGERNRQAESLRDQVLSALDQAVTRRTNGAGVPVDKLSSVVQAIPHLEVIYPDPEERRRVLQAIRHELKNRLGDSMLAADPVQPTGAPQIELDPHSAEDGHPTTIINAPDNGVEEHAP